MSETKENLKREKVRIIEISKIKDFPDHPFLVRDDENMEQLIRSIEMNGVLNPVIARKIDDDNYEMVAGHRRKYACIRLGIDRIPLIGREMTREEAIIEMVDSNLYREMILPSEKARAYKMKYEALKRKAGRPSKENCAPSEHNFEGKRTVEILGEENGESKEQIRRFIRLNELIPELLELVDEGKIGMRPAVEISYLQEEEQRDLLETIETEESYPSHAQAIRMKELSRKGELDMDAIFAIMTEQKGNQKEKIKIPMEKLETFFARGTPPQEVERTIIKALAFYCKHRGERKDVR